MSENSVDNWATHPLMDRFLGNTKPFCPYCDYEFESMPGAKRKCPGCHQFIYKRTRPQDEEHVIVREDDREMIEEQWSIKNGDHESFLKEKKHREETVSRLNRGDTSAPSEMKDFEWLGVADPVLAGKIKLIFASWHREGFHEFRRQCQSRLGRCPSRNQLDLLFRNLSRSAYSFDSEQIASQNDIVNSIFPYAEILPIDDARTTKEHRFMATAGLNGTGVYRRDDPVYARFKPPWGMNCRCGSNMLTVEAAARKGVEEAWQWNQSGDPPNEPDWVATPLFEPETIPCEIMGVPGEIPYLKKLINHGDKLEVEWASDILDEIAAPPIMTRSAKKKANK